MDLFLSVYLRKHNKLGKQTECFIAGPFLIRPNSAKRGNKKCVSNKYIFSCVFNYTKKVDSELDWN